MNKILIQTKFRESTEEKLHLQEKDLVLWKMQQKFFFATEQQFQDVQEAFRDGWNAARERYHDK